MVDETINPADDSVTPCLWDVEVTAELASDAAGKRVPLAATVESIAQRLGVDLSVTTDSYAARFSVLAPTDVDALGAAHRRWFYLGNDLDMPAWPVTYSVTPVDLSAELADQPAAGPFWSPGQNSHENAKPQSGRRGLRQSLKDAVQ